MTPINYVAVDQMASAARARLLAARTPGGHWKGQLSSSALSTATSVCAFKLFLDAARDRSTDDPGPLHTRSEPRASDFTNAQDRGRSRIMLASADNHVDYNVLIRRGVAWLSEHQNADGGWGDTVDSPSNISTTMLCWAALRAVTGPVWSHGPPPGAGRSDRPFQNHAGVDRADVDQTVMNRVEGWLKDKSGDLTATNLAGTLDNVYGKDRTFAVPILTMCALAGCLGTGRNAWRFVRPLPFELAVLPHRWFKWLGLPVVSYALPALIAIGQVRHYYRPSRNPFARLLRQITRSRTLRVLRSIQPAGGGFLEAAPITGFVAMSLASMGLTDHPVTKGALAFLADSVRDDGSWPIDTNLATWLTTLSIGALAASPVPRDEFGSRSPDDSTGRAHDDTALSADERAALRRWLLDQQYRHEHPYTHAAPGGWAWTDLSGGVPDADDTAGALLALWRLASRDQEGRFADGEVLHAVNRGVRWLLDLQNRDGGIPTFCRGWGKLPFDQSSPDLTAHALRAWSAWKENVPAALRSRINRATRRAVYYLLRRQRDDGAWVPLWFGHQRAEGQANPLYGTARVLGACDVALVGEGLQDEWLSSLGRGVRWIVTVQNQDGGWGGDRAVPSSIEETALAVEALVGVLLSWVARGKAEPRSGFSRAEASRDRQGTVFCGRDDASHGATRSTLLSAIARGSTWLMEHTERGTRFAPTPIGLYFAKLWYSERLYPLIFTVAALGRVRRLGSEGAA